MNNDTELDNLIMATLQRQQIVEEINQTVMKDVRRTARRTLLRRWARVAAFSFGLPLVAMFCLYNIFTLAESYQKEGMMLLCLAIPSVAVVLGTIRAVEEFRQ